jgi:hypothetical protein
MSKFIYCVAVLFCLCSVVRAAEPVNVEQAAQEAGEKAAQSVRDAQAKAQQRAADAARRASRTWTECAKENGSYAYSVGKYGVMMAGAGVANADGYVAAAVAIPSTYVGTQAFGLGASMSAAAK